MLIALLSLLSPPALACGHADQYRLVPLGMQGDTVIALELDQLRRDDMTSSGDLRLFWIVTPSLVAISEQAAPLKTYPAVEVDDDQYEAGLASTLQQAQQDAAALVGFTPLSPTRHLDCGYFPTCTGLDDPRQGGSVWTDPSRYASHEGAPQGAAGMGGWRLGSVRAYGQLTVVTVGDGKHFDQYPPEPRPATSRTPSVLSREGVPHHGISVDVIVR